jgi:hypothetical protein
MRRSSWSINVCCCRIAVRSCPPLEGAVEEVGNSGVAASAALSWLILD